MQIDDAAVVSVKRDVAAILRNSRPHAGIQQFLDLADNLAVLTGMLGMTRRRGPALFHHRQTRLEMLHDRAEDSGLDMIPLDLFCLRHGDKVITKEYAAYTIHRKNPRRQ